MPIIQVLERLGEEDEQLQASMGTEQDSRRKGGSMRSSSHSNNISIRKESITLFPDSWIFISISWDVIKTLNHPPTKWNPELCCISLSFKTNLKQLLLGPSRLWHFQGTVSSVDFDGI